CSSVTYGTGRTQGLQTITDIVRAPSLRGEEKDEIAYAPRPPVVEPPSTASLPPPGGTTGSVALASNWPVDPDQQAEATRLRIAAAEANGEELNLPRLPVRGRSA